MKRTPNEKGAAIVWAIMSVLLISLTAAGLVFVSRTYYMREQEENHRIQARLYAESAIELIAGDITANQEGSVYVSEDNTTRTVDVEFPDAANWDCTVSIHHSKVNLSTPETRKKSGDIYLTARVTRESSDGKAIELSEVCARLVYQTGAGWTFKGFYNL